MSYIGWLLPEAERSKLLQKFPPAYHDIIAHHVTLTLGKNTPLPLETSGDVVGVIDDGVGCQALVVSINGSTKRPDGLTYHITWSIDRDNHNRKPKHSAEVLNEYGWVSTKPICIELVPTLFK